MPGPIMARLREIIANAQARREERQAAQTPTPALQRQSTPQPQRQSSGGNSTSRGDPVVLALQQSLRDRGFDPGPLDGIMGPRTRAAMEASQQAEMDAQVPLPPPNPSRPQEMPLPRPRPEPPGPIPQARMDYGADNPVPAVGGPGYALGASGATGMPPAGNLAGPPPSPTAPPNYAMDTTRGGTMAANNPELYGRQMPPTPPPPPPGGLPPGYGASQQLGGFDRFPRQSTPAYTDAPPMDPPSGAIGGLPVMSQSLTPMQTPQGQSFNSLPTSPFAYWQNQIGQPPQGMYGPNMMPPYMPFGFPALGGEPMAAAGGAAAGLPLAADPRPQQTPPRFGGGRRGGGGIAGLLSLSDPLTPAQMRVLARELSGLDPSVFR